MYVWLPLPKDAEEKLCTNNLGDSMHIMEECTWKILALLILPLC